MEGPSKKKIKRWNFLNLVVSLTWKLWGFFNINFIVRKMVDFSVVLVPLSEEADDRVEEEEEEEDQDEDLLGSDLYLRVLLDTGNIAGIIRITRAVTN